MATIPSIFYCASPNSAKLINIVVIPLPLKKEYTVVNSNFLNTFRKMEVLGLGFGIRLGNAHNCMYAVE